MTKEDAQEYKDYPEGSGGKKSYDRFFLPFDEYLKKYYSKPEFDTWERWFSKYIEPAFEDTRHDEMIKNFGYVKKEYYDFIIQYDVYNQLKNDERIDNDVKQFIGFLAGAGFFKKHNLTVEKWFDMQNWHNPYVENLEGKTLNQILSYSYGINYFKILLTQMPFWNR